MFAWEFEAPEVEYNFAGVHIFYLGGGGEEKFAQEMRFLSC